VSQEGDDRKDQFLGLVHPVKGATLGGAEGARTPFASVAALFLAVDDDVPFAFAGVSAALSVVTKLLVRVHA
jgi:hypothetical protein